MPDPNFSIDTCSLVTPWRDWYRPLKFPRVWDLVDELMVQGRLFASRAVLSEINRQDDTLAEWVNQRREFFLELDGAAQEHVQRITGTHFPQFQNSPGDDIWADPEVIALALAEEREVLVVTEENRSGGPHKLKIPDVCDIEGVECIKFADMLDRVDHDF